MSFHPRNRHQGSYDFPALIAASPALRQFVFLGRRCEREGVDLHAPAAESVDFTDPEAVRALNTALLRLHYQIPDWQLPAGYLCPPIPGRADYVHALAELLQTAPSQPRPVQRPVRALDIGVGASCIYPLIAEREYRWHTVGCDIDAAALAAAQRNVELADAAHAVQLRLQPQRGSVLHGVILPGDYFDVTLCNPPFHASATEAARSSARKWRNLGYVGAEAAVTPRLNFGGQAAELWCTGGEASFIKRMVRESASYTRQVGWFSTLVAKAEHLSEIEKQIKKAGAVEIRVVPMAQGAKQSRFVAWRFANSS